MTRDGVGEPESVVAGEPPDAYNPLVADLLERHQRAALLGLALVTAQRMAACDLQDDELARLLAQAAVRTGWLRRELDRRLRAAGMRP